ncbi:hypothetical protein V6N11_082651 [Hibiscus sabdariffa]|uniref:Uncharacterized protein n=1 Tax=Hibiscus sabdariffa TaxID=183260 RepID=A0ABR2P9D6_9ROSI
MEAKWKSLEGTEGQNSVVSKMKRMKSALISWNHNSFGNIDAQYVEIVKNIEQLDARMGGVELSPGTLLRKRELQSRLWKISRYRESLWQQKSRATWLAEGDRNTSFFHRQVKIRLMSNSIMGLQHNGHWETNPERLKFLFFKELNSHFASTPPIGPL